MGSAKTVSVAVVAIFYVVAAVPKFHKVTVHLQELSADEDIMFDEDEKYAVVTVSKVYGNLRPTINLHDYANGYSVMKDVANKTCNIHASRETMEAMKNGIEKALQNNGEHEITQNFDCSTKYRIPKSALTLFGPRIAAFCENYNLAFVERHLYKRNKRSMLSEDTTVCVLCSCKTERKDEV